MTVEVRNVSVTAEDSSIIFGSTGAATTTTVFNAAPATAVGDLRSIALVGPIGPMLEVGLRTGGASATTIRLTLSIDVIGRTS